MEQYIDIQRLLTNTHALDFPKPLAQKSTWETCWTQSESFRTAKLRTETEAVLLLFCLPCAAAATRNSFQFLFSLELQLFGWILPVHRASSASGCPRGCGDSAESGRPPLRGPHTLPSYRTPVAELPQGPTEPQGLMLPSQTGTFGGQTAPAWGEENPSENWLFLKNACHIKWLSTLQFSAKQIRDLQITFPYVPVEVFWGHTVP